jgi:hypothetical protein
LGAETPIYEAGDLPDFLPKTNILIRDVVDQLYDVRNYIAHGDRVPDKFFQHKMRRGVNGDLSLIPVLVEALSFILRKSLLRILTENLLSHFESAASSESYFGAVGLTNSDIREKDKLEAERQAQSSIDHEQK